MTAPLFLSDDLAGDVVVLTGPEGHHAATVRRVQPGEAVDVADGHGTRVHCTVLRVTHDAVELRVDRRVVEARPAPWLVVAQAIAKGDRGELAVELATEVGVDEVLPWAAQRCVVKWEGPRGQKALGRWRSTATAAGKQSRRARHPLVGEQVDLDALLARAASATTYVLHEQATTPLARVEVPQDGEVLLVVGPEGGVTDGELGRLVGAGATAVRLGSSVLRTSTAGAAAAAVVSARTARWA